jgi:MFS family permease
MVTSRHQVRVLGSALVVTLVSTLPVFLTGSLAVEIGPDLDFDRAALGIAISGFFVTSALGSVGLGRLAGHRGWPTAMRIAATASMASMLGIALAARTWMVMAIFLAIGGLSMAVGNPAVNRALATEIPVARQGLVFGVKHSAVPAAALLSGLALPVFALTVGWRPVFAGAAVLAGLVILAPPRTASATSSGRRGSEQEDAVALGPLAALASGALLAASGASALSAFLVVSVVDAGIAPGTAGVLLGVSSVGGLMMRLGAGWWVDRRAAGGLGGVAVLLVIGSVGFAMLAGSASWILTTGAIIGFMAGWGWNGLFNFAVVKSHPRAPARATSIALTGTYIGAAAGPALFGIVVEAASFSVAWLATAVVLLMGAAVMLIARSRLPTPTAADRDR